MINSRCDVLLVISSLRGGGAERVATNLCNQWSKDGLSVVIVTKSSNDQDSYSLSNKVKRISLGMEAISRGFGSGLKANLARIRELRSVIKSERARVVISFNTSTNVLATLAVQGLACRLIVSERNYPAHSAANRFWSVARKFTYKLADTVVVQTKPGALWLERNTLAKSVEVVPNSISLPIPRLEPTVNPDDHLPADRRVILAVGKIQRQKGFDLLLEACAQLTSSSNEWVLVIAGAGDNQALRQQSEQAGLADRVLFPGRVGNIGDWFQRADIFVLSSRYEGFPNVLLEAMANGCAAVSFDCLSGPADVIQPGLNGVLVTPGDCTGLAQEIDKLLQNEPERARLAENAKAVKTTFSEARVMGEWMSILQRYLGVDRKKDET